MMIHVSVAETIPATAQDPVHQSLLSETARVLSSALVQGWLEIRILNAEGRLRVEVALPREPADLPDAYTWARGHPLELSPKAIVADVHRRIEVGGQVAGRRLPMNLSSIGNHPLPFPVFPTVVVNPTGLQAVFATIDGMPKSALRIRISPYKADRKHLRMASTAAGRSGAGLLYSSSDLLACYTTSGPVFQIAVQIAAASNDKLKDLASTLTAAAQNRVVAVPRVPQYVSGPQEASEWKSFVWSVGRVSPPEGDLVRFTSRDLTFLQQAAYTYTGDELVSWLALPIAYQYGYSGVRTVLYAPGAGSPPIRTGDAITLGAYMVNGTPREFQLASQDLAQHVAVVGITGSGKTNFAQLLCTQLDVPWTVVSPTGAQSYKKLLEQGAKRFHVDNPEEDGFLSLDLFYRLPGEDESRTLDRVFSTLSAAWPLYGMLGHTLYQAVTGLLRIPPEEWSLRSLADVARHLLQQDQDPEYRRNAEAAILRRIQLIINSTMPLYWVFHQDPSQKNGPIGIDELTQSPVVVDLSGLSRQEDLSLVYMFLLLLYRDWARLLGESENIRRVLVLDEAHTVASAVQPVHVAAADAPTNAQGSEAVRFLYEGLLREGRARGLSLVTMDQNLEHPIPRVAAVNSGLRIGFQTTDGQQRALVGSALNLTDEQTAALAGLEAGEAYVACRSFALPVRVRFDRA